MFIVTGNILVLLLALLLTGVNLFLVTVLARLGLGQIPAAAGTPILQAFTQITDPVLCRVQQKAAQWTHHPCPSWLGWTIIIALALIVRHLLWLMIGSMVVLPT
jgi:hypothetical protein